MKSGAVTLGVSLLLAGNTGALGVVLFAVVPLETTWGSPSVVPFGSDAMTGKFYPKQRLPSRSTWRQGVADGASLSFSVASGVQI